MNPENSSVTEDNASKKMLKFTCPSCGSHRLEEVVLMRQDIEGVYDPEDPEYDWYYDTGGMVVISRTVYAVPSEANFYRCYDCEASLTDEDGHEFWEAERIYRWLKGLPLTDNAAIEHTRNVHHECNDQEQSLVFTCPECGGHELMEFVEQGEEVHTPITKVSYCPDSGEAELDYDYDEEWSRTKFREYTYLCAECKHQVTYGTEEALAEWLRENCEQAPESKENAPSSDTE
jgi:predicted RNA-binding Zn-ribbon protein involved in translation (DUF1610 family)